MDEHSGAVQTPKNLAKRLFAFFTVSASLPALLAKLVLVVVLPYAYLLAVCALLDLAGVINTDAAAYFCLFSFLALCVGALWLAVVMIRRYRKK